MRAAANRLYLRRFSQSLATLLAVAVLILSPPRPAEAQEAVVVAWSEGAPFFIEEDGEPTGFAAELARRIGEIAGLDLQFEGFDAPAAAFDGFAAGEADLLVGVTPNLRFETEAAYSDSVAEAAFRLFVRAEDADRIDPETAADLRIRFGGAAAIEGALFERNTILRKPPSEEMVLELLRGDIDGLITSAAALAIQLRNTGLEHRIVAVGEPLLRSRRVIAVNKGRPELLAPINAAIAELEESGDLAALRQTWLIDAAVREPAPEVLVVGAGHYPPYQMLNDDGAATGFAVEVLRELAHRAALTLRFEQIDAEGWRSGPGPDTFDLLPQATVTDDRSARYDFSLPIKQDAVSIFTRSEDVGRIKNLDDLVGLRVGVQRLNVGARVAAAHGGLDLQQTETPADLVRLLESGEVDAVVYAAEPFERVLAAAGTRSIRQAIPPVQVTQRAIMLRKGLGDVRERLNGVIPGYLISQEYRALREKYFGAPTFWTPQRTRWAFAAALGLFVGVLGVFVLGNYRARRRAEAYAKAAQALSDRLNAVLNATQNGVMGLNRQGQVVIANPSARHILGGVSAPTPFDWPEAISFLNVETMKPLERSSNPVHRTLAGQTLRGETALLSRKAEAEPRYLRLSSAQISAEEGRQSDSAARVVIVMDDISEQEKKRQQLERSSRLDALGQLTGGIAHDFNNLLATIQYAVQLASRAQNEEKRRLFLQTALDTVERGATLIKRLLAFAKRQPGLAKAGRVGDLFDDFASLAKPAIEENIHLEFSVEGEALWVFCDLPQLENALLNLVLNSRDAINRAGKGDKIMVKARGVDQFGPNGALSGETPHSYISKGLRAEHDADQARDDDRRFRYVEFAVTDNGPGMDSETRRRAIDPFFSTKDSGGATGLGLSMVYGFVQQAGGEMRIYSELGYGATVRMLLPRGTPDSDREAPIQREAAPEGRGQRILLVEDEEILLAVLSDVVLSLGYEILTAASGKAALDLIDQGEPFDLLLTDVVMPGGISGFELARLVRERRPSMPVLYTSGYTGFSEAEMGEVVAPMIQKPGSPAELARAIKRALAECDGGKAPTEAWPI